MVKLVAIVSFLLAGSPVGDPATFSHRDRWPNVEACEAVRVSPANEEALAQLKAFAIASFDGDADGATIETKCVPAE